MKLNCFYRQLRPLIRVVLTYSQEMQTSTKFRFVHKTVTEDDHEPEICLSFGLILFPSTLCPNILSGINLKITLGYM